ncbi:unnamed protein product [Effrenium voratum]|uniref:Uncharacterized protein n=1 Tax=Effrenium voratum TaxID=2562239 RepID=A0AA36MT65_9DINO|nr:unnamed protein product [Effrenium voratum]CAJ1384990.1 unnamed protein product [Effrenium voratum]
MLRLAVFILLHGGVLAISEKDKEKEEKVLRESIEAASIVRAKGDYNDDPNCKWPICAPVCDDCPSKGVGSCMIPGVDECTWSSKCKLGTCFCSKGYCAEGSQCKLRTCALGARPPPYVADSLVHRFANLGAELPPFNADKQDWQDYFDGCRKLPLILVVVGVCIGILTFILICFQLECEPSWMPTSPVLLLVLCVITVVVICTGVISRGTVVGENMDMIEEQMSRVDKSLDSAVSLAEELKTMAEEFEAVVKDLPTSCNSMVPGAKEMMGMASDKANEILFSLKQKVDAFSTVADLAHSVVTKMINAFWQVKVMVILVPMVPLVLMGLWTLAIAVATVLSWQSPDPNVAERADDAVIRFGAGGACCAMLVATVLTAMYLYCGIVAGGFCMNLDANVVSLTTTVNFTELSKFKFNIDPILNGAVQYYVFGSQENPIMSMIEDVERDATALYTVYTNASWAVQPAEMICTGIKNLNASQALQGCQQTVQFASELMSARNMYPYYDTFARELVCHRMLSGMNLLIIYTLVVSLILMPCVALLADVDLRKWERYKMNNYEQHYDMKYEAQERSPFLESALHAMPKYNLMQQQTSHPAQFT